MNRWILFALIGGVLLGGLAGCKKRSEVKTAPSAITLLPEGASPGMIVHVSSTDPLFAGAPGATVVVGGQRASVTRVISDTEAEVLVPNVAAGATKMTVSDAKGKGTHSADFTVLPARAQQLVLKWKEGRLELVAVHPTSGEPSGRGELGGEPQLSFDVVNEAGAVVYTGAMANPMQRRMEIFDGPDAKTAKLRREKMEREMVFAVKVPKLPGRATVRFFEAQAGIDLLQAQARENRRLIGEIQLTGGGQ